MYPKDEPEVLALMVRLWELAGEVGTYAEKHKHEGCSAVYVKLSEALDEAESYQLINADPEGL